MFAKLTFDDEFIDKRQVEKARPPKLGSKLGGFAKVGTIGSMTILMHILMTTE